MLDEGLLLELAVHVITHRPRIVRRRHGNGEEDILLRPHVGQRIGGPVGAVEVVRQCGEDASRTAVVGAHGPRVREGGRGDGSEDVILPAQVATRYDLPARSGERCPLGWQPGTLLGDPVGARREDVGRGKVGDGRGTGYGEQMCHGQRVQLWRRQLRPKVCWSEASRE
jgi:hypothetical protein